MDPNVTTKPVSAELFEVVFEQNVMGMALRAVDPVRPRWLRVNQKLCDMLGYSMEEMLQLTSTEMSYPGEQHHSVHYNQLLEAGEIKSYSREKRYIRKDGSALWTNVWLSPVLGGDGKPIQIITVIQDISEQKKAEEARTESEARLRAIFDNAPACMNLKDLQGRYIYANKQYGEWWGLNVDDVIGKTAHEFHANMRSLETMAEVEQKVLETGETYETEITINRENTAEPRDRLLIKFPVKSPEEKIIGLGTFAVDITERKKAEAELRQHRDHLQDMVDRATESLRIKAQELQTALAKEKELNELQEQFVSMASHEFRTPLTIIDTAAQRLKRKLDTDNLDADAAHQKIENIRSAVRRMTRLMESTLTAAQLNEGKIAIEIAPCSPATLLQEACTRQAELAPMHQITCNISRLPAEIAGDSGSLEQVFSNLLSNAVKYSPSDPRVEVVGWEEDSHAVIAVRDYGIGIDDEDLGQVGEKFFRAKTSTGIAGTGIGLNLTKTLVEMHGGSLTISSKAGEGSVFVIRLPIAGPANQNIDGGSEQQVA